jgi:N-acetylglucosaminyl-diphospho-decaprenol L-rhamnosyltransferase
VESGGKGMKLRVNLVVLNYNAEDLLRKYLPSVVAAAHESRHDCRVTVLDNASTDGSAEYVRKNHPGVALWIAKENRVLCSYNDFARESDDDILMLLNNDLRLHPGWVDPLAEVFLKEKSAFFAASHGNRALALFRRGILEPSTDGGDSLLMERPGLTLSAGVAAFDRKKFLELGGFDDLYLPGRYEDVDLCYRGWKRGWKGYYVPVSTQDHEGETSFKKAFGWHRTQRMVFRNSLLFMTKNMDDPLWRLRFLAFLPARLLTAALQFKFYMWQGAFDYLGRLPQALARRRGCRAQAFISDREVVRLVNGAARGI